MSIEDAANRGLAAIDRDVTGTPVPAEELPGAPITESHPSRTRKGAERTNRSVAARFFSRPTGWIPVAIVVVILVLVYGAPLWGLQDPAFQSPRDSNLLPSAAHWLGTDGQGRDVWSRLIWGGQPAFTGAFIVLVVGLVLGVPGGLIAGYYGKAVDSVLSWISDMLMSLPAIILLIIIASLTHQDMYLIMAAMGVLLAPGYYRLTRAATIAVRGEPYVDAARVAGISSGRIMFSHIWRVIAAPIIIQTALTAGMALSMQAGLALVGAISSQAPGWGAMMQQSMGAMRTNAWLVVPPSVMLGLLIACFAIIGTTLGDITGNRSEKTKRLTSRERSALAAAAAAHANGASKPDEEFTVLVKGLKVTYAMAKRRIEVVHGVDFAVKKGEVLGIVGESGSGKSQSIFALLDLLPGNGFAEADEIWIDGKNVLTISEGQRRSLLGTTIGYIPQEPISNLDPMFTIGFQLTEPMRKVLRMSRKDAHEYALQLLTRVGINDPARVMKLHPHEISGGMAQRVLIAGAVAGRPKLIVADEPTTALDVTVQAEVLELLRELQQEYGMALIIVTHNFGVVADIADYVTVMQNGLVVEKGDVRQIFRSPEDPYTAELIEASNEIETRAEIDAGLALAGAAAAPGAGK